jgi:hypothetical protein
LWRWITDTSNSTDFFILRLYVWWYLSLLLILLYLSQFLTTVCASLYTLLVLNSLFSWIDVDSFLPIQQEDSFFSLSSLIFFFIIFTFPKRYLRAFVHLLYSLVIEKSFLFFFGELSISWKIDFKNWNFYHTIVLGKKTVFKELSIGEEKL